MSTELLVNQRTRTHILLSCSHFTVLFLSVSGGLLTLIVARVKTISERVKNPIGSSVAQ